MWDASRRSHGGSGGVKRRQKVVDNTARVGDEEGLLETRDPSGDDSLASWLSRCKPKNFKTSSKDSQNKSKQYLKHLVLSAWLCCDLADWLAH